MKMKLRIAKILSLIFILAISLNLTACGGKSSIGNILSDTTPPPSSEISNQTEEPNQQQGQQETDTPSTVIIDLSEGTYEGELDENGLFTGWGVWNYPKYNIRYEGYFENGAPNGEGTMYEYPDDYWVHVTQQGQWVNGIAHGELKISAYGLYGENRDKEQIETVVFEVVNGSTPSNIIVPVETNMEINIDNPPTMEISSESVYGVPPWVFAHNSP